MLGLGSVYRTRGDWGAIGWNPSSSACGRVGPGLKFRPEGWQDDAGKIISLRVVRVPPGGRRKAEGGGEGGLAVA